MGVAIWTPAIWSEGPIRPSPRQTPALDTRREAADTPPRTMETGVRASPSGAWVAYNVVSYQLDSGILER